VLETTNLVIDFFFLSLIFVVSTFSSGDRNSLYIKTYLISAYALNT